MKNQQRSNASKRNGQAQSARSPRQLVEVVGAARKLEPGETEGCAAAVDRFAEAVARVEAIPVTLTLREICCIIGEGVDPHRFAWTAFDALASEIEAVAHINGNEPGAEVWRPLLSIAERARLASRIERQLSE